MRIIQKIGHIPSKYQHMIFTGSLIGLGIAFRDGNVDPVFLAAYLIMGFMLGCIMASLMWLVQHWFPSFGDTDRKPRWLKTLITALLAFAILVAVGAYFLIP